MPYPPEQIVCEHAGAGPPALLVHGIPATHSLWRPIVARLADVRTLYTPDLPGLGATPAPADRADYAFDRLVASMLGLADRLGLERFDLVGHSFGGALAIAVAASAPGRIRTLTVITPMTDRMPPLAFIGRVPILERALAALWHAAPGGLRRWVVRNWAHVSYGAAYTPTRAREVAGEADRPGLIDGFTGLITGVDRAWYGTMIDRLAGLDRPPILLVGAGRDRVIPYRHFVELCSRLQRARTYSFPDGSHIPLWQHPDAVAGLLREFWLHPDATDPASDMNR